MSKLMLSLALLLAGICRTSSSSPAFTRSISTRALFGIARGGGLFSGKDEKKEEENTSTPAVDGNDTGAVDGASRPKFPAMTKEEVEEWLDHITVFSVTDSKGAGLVFKPDNNTSILYFFMNPLMANATLQQLQSSATNIDLRVSAFSLGRIWFKLLSSEADQEVLLKIPGEEGNGTVAQGVQYRLVPDTHDLLGARMLLTMTPEDGEKLQAGGELTPEMAQAAIEKAMTQATKFNTSYNEIPVFMIAQMRMQKKPEEGEKKEDEEPLTLLPMFFSFKNMMGTWKQFMAGAPVDLQGLEPAINLMSLHDLIEMMQKETEIDFRNVVLVPPSPASFNPGEASDGGVADTEVDPMMSTMGGSTLGDI